ncbi:MAG: hypothetical protein VX013_10125, partial [Pseudomonadota bacterium]|nr:hypothetical protein [Pseudomonadota bacterium]
MPIAARASSAEALSVMPDEELLLAEPPELLELLDEDPEEPDEPALDEVDAEEAAVEELDSPLLSVVVCDAVSHAAMKKATATSAIRRCNMLML